MFTRNNKDLTSALLHQMIAHDASKALKICKRLLAYTKKMPFPQDNFIFLITIIISFEYV